MRHTKFRGNRRVGSREEDFWRVFTIYRRGGHFGHVTSIMSSDFHFLIPQSFNKKMVQIGTVVSEKKRFEFLYVHDLGPRSRNDLDLQYSHSFIYSIRCLLLLAFRSLAAIVSEKSTVFTFSYRKAKVIKFDLAVNRSRSLHGHHLKKQDGLESPMLHTKFRENRLAGSGEKNFSRVLTIYRHGRHLGQVTKCREQTLVPPT